jgi:hypothetical protein
MKHLKLALGPIITAGLIALTAAPAMAAQPIWVDCVKAEHSHWMNSTCTKAGTGEWETKAVIETSEVTSTGDFELEDAKATGGATALKCEESDEGTVGPEGQDSIRRITDTDCTFVKAGSCETAVEPKVNFVDLPWSTRLEERENTETHKIELRDLIRSLTTEPPGWDVECEVAGIFKISDICTGGTSTSVMSNRADGATEFEFDDVSAQEPDDCSVGGADAGFTRGVVIGKLRNKKGELQALWILAHILDT